MGTRVTARLFGPARKSSYFQKTTPSSCSQFLTKRQPEQAKVTSPKVVSPNTIEK